MAKVGSGMVRRSRRGRGQRRPTTWEISDSDTEGPVGAEADSEAAVRARDPAEKRRAAAEERRAAAEALRLLRPKQALRRLAVRVDPGAPEREGRCPGEAALRLELGFWKLLLVTGRLSPAHGGVTGASVKAASWPRIGAGFPTGKLD